MVPASHRTPTLRRWAGWLVPALPTLVALNIDDRPGADPGHRVLEWWATAGGATDHQDGGALREDSRTLVESVGELELLLVVE